MKYLYPFVLTILFFINSSVWSQSWVINNNSKIKMQAGTFVVIDGNVQNDNNGEFDNLGTIQLTGNWTNNAGNTAFVNSSPGTVVLNGANQLINGTDSTVFYNLNLEGSGSKQIDVNTSVEGVLSLNDKEFLTNNFSLFILNSLPQKPQKIMSRCLIKRPSLQLLQCLIFFINPHPMIGQKYQIV